VVESFSFETIRYPGWIRPVSKTKRTRAPINPVIPETIFLTTIRLNCPTQDGLMQTDLEVDKQVLTKLPANPPAQTTREINPTVRLRPVLMRLLRGRP
jgi:hypothetical protein